MHTYVPYIAMSGLPPFFSEIMSVSSSSSDIHAIDIGLGLPLLVAPSDGGNAHPRTWWNGGRMGLLLVMVGIT